MGWRPVALPLVGLLAAGCAVSAVDLRDSLNLNQASFQDKLAAQQVLIDEFSACTACPYDELGNRRLRDREKARRTWRLLLFSNHPAG